MKIILVMLLLLSAISAYAHIWMDDFEDGLSKEWTSSGWCADSPAQDWKAEDGILKGRCPNWDAQMLFLPEYPSLDYTMQVKCKIEEVMQIPEYACAGFIFRATGPAVIGKCTGPFYCCWVGPFLCGFIISDGNIWDTTGNVQKLHNLEQWYTLKLVANGNKFTGYVDDRPFWTITDNKYKGKFVGLWLGCNINASFDDFMISERVDKGALTDFDVSPAGRLATAWGYIKTK